MTALQDVATLSSSDLLAATCALAQTACSLEAELLVHLGEIDERKLYLDRAFSSMFAFCTSELGFSEYAAYNRIMVARAARRLPALLDAICSRQVHLAGVRVLVPHLTEENHREVLAQAAGKSKREIEELAARLSPQPPAPTVVRKLPERSPAAPEGERVPVAPAAPTGPPAPAWPPPLLTHAKREEHRPVVAPTAEDTFKIQFTAGRPFCDKLRHAQDLLRHRVPDGDLAKILDKALDVLIETTSKQRFAAGRKPRPAAAKRGAGQAPSRHIPNAIKRAVFERDGGRCTFVNESGRRCAETGALEFDHLDRFARTRLHEVDRMRLLCRAHNQHAAEQMYGREFMETARTCREWPSIRSGTSPPPRLP
jgi:hypothetical protein